MRITATKWLHGILILNTWKWGTTDVQIEKKIPTESIKKYLYAQYTDASFKTICKIFVRNESQSKK